LLILTHLRSFNRGSFGFAKNQIMRLFVYIWIAMIEEPLFNLTPISFFQIRADIPYVKEALLPDTSALNNEIPFAEVAMSWSEEGLHFHLLSKRPVTHVAYPSFQRGDSFEVFIDTRDMKSASFNTRFCHHFFCLPTPTDEDIQAGEVTRFRTEDAHELCSPKDLIVRSELFKKGYTLDFMIPKHCLHGYEPEQFDRLGFTYRVNTYGAEPQHFSVNSRDFPIEQGPSLWSSVRLVK
jgi:hypothetical protein